MQQLLPVELFPGAVLLHQERSGQHSALVGAEALAALQAFAAPADSAAGVVVGVDDFGICFSTVRTTH